jgi:hypothetical protein
MLKDVLKDRFTAKWWKTDPVEQDKLNAVLEAAYLAPIKNGKCDHELMVLTDSAEARAIKEYLYFENTWCGDGRRKKPNFTGMKRYNGQLLAPVVLLWSANISSAEISEANENEKQRIRDNCLLQAGFAMCAAEEQGLRTGINSTQGGIEIARHLGLENKDCLLSMGIGYADIEKSKRHQKPVFQGASEIDSHPNNETKVYGNAYNLLINNKTFIQKEVKKYVNYQRASRSPAFVDQSNNSYLYIIDRCNRDIAFVIDALADGLQHNNTDAIVTTVSEYWYEKKLQVKYQIEDEVHNFIKVLVTQYLLTNTPFTARQTVTAQFIDAINPAEDNAIEHVNQMYQLFLNGLTGQGTLDQIGFDLTNISPVNTTFPNRKFKPAFGNMIKYI